ncbi:MAG: NAD-glutamate dehydrogenase, partial [Gammaproteobacteria bacterium]
MLSVKNGECQDIINQVKSYVQNEVSDKDLELLETFIQRYYSSCSVDDLKTHTIADLAAIVCSHWKFIYQREPGVAKVRIFNPDKATDGWTSTHSVIQISHDDIPFLVDSTRMVINRFGDQIHFIVHFGGLKVRRDNHHRIVEIFPLGMADENATSEAPIYIEIDRIADEKEMDQLKIEIENALADVRVAVADWRKMLARVEECLT